MLIWQNRSLPLGARALVGCNPSLALEIFALAARLGGFLKQTTVDPEQIRKRKGCVEIHLAACNQALIEAYLASGLIKSTGSNRKKEGK